MTAKKRVTFVDALQGGSSKKYLQGNFYLRKILVIATNLTAICEPIVKKMWDPRRLTTLWASTACYRDIFTFTFLL
jgi:hypothetical protein